MKAISCAPKTVSRRDLLKTATLAASGLVLAGAGLIAVPGLSLAEGIDTSTLPFAGMTIAQFEEAMDPEHYAGLPEEVKQELASCIMYETPSGTEGLTRAEASASVYFTSASGGYRQVGFSFIYNTGVSCQGLNARVTLSNSSGYFSEKNYSGSGTELMGSGTFYSLPKGGTYSLVVTAYAAYPSSGFTVPTRQSIRSINVQ